MNTKSPKKSTQTGMGQVQSLLRGLTILEQLAQSTSGLNLTEVSEQVGLPPSTTHRLLNSLQQMNFVVQDEQRGEWSVGVKAFSVGNAYLKSRDFVAAARPFMRDLVVHTGETSNLAILEGLSPVFVAQVECGEMMRMVAKLGSRAPLHASGVGKALLSQQAADKITRILQQSELTEFTQKTITSIDQMLAELQCIREKGFALDNEEQSIGLRCVASNIYNEHGEAVAAVSISGPSTRITDQRLVELGALMQSTAKDITLSLGGTFPV